MEKPFQSDLGWIAFALGDAGVCALSFGYRTAGGAKQALTKNLGGNAAGGAEGAGCVDPGELVDRLLRFAAGEEENLSDVPVDTSHLTPFARRVVEVVRELPWGVTRSYSEVAAASGRPRAARAVGSVMARNRAPLLVPCHRVLGAGGGLGGYSAPGGLATKRRLLAMEAVAGFV